MMYPYGPEEFTELPDGDKLCMDLIRCNVVAQTLVRFDSLPAHVIRFIDFFRHFLVCFNQSINQSRQGKAVLVTSQSINQSILRTLITALSTKQSTNQSNINGNTNNQSIKRSIFEYFFNETIKYYVFCQVDWLVYWWCNFVLFSDDANRAAWNGQTPHRSDRESLFRRGDNGGTSLFPVFRH